MRSVMIQKYNGGHIKCVVMSYNLRQKQKKLNNIIVQTQLNQQKFISKFQNIKLFLLLIFSEEQEQIQSMKKVNTINENKIFKKLQIVLGQNLISKEEADFCVENSIDTYGCYTNLDIKNIANTYITAENFKNIVLDTMKFYQIYDALRLAIQQQLGEHQYYNVRKILQIAIQGKFYRFMTMKIQNLKVLTNNRTTCINIKTIISGILAFTSKRLNLKQISDALMIYQLEEALYKTAPYGIYLESQKIMETFKKIQRIIKNQKYKIWLQKVKQESRQDKYAQPYHFLYLVSLSQKKSSKTQDLFKIRNKSQYINGSASRKVVKFIDSFSQLENQSKNCIKSDYNKIKGLSFYTKKQKQNSQCSENFSFLKKSMINFNHKRSKSLAFSRAAQKSLKQDFQQNNFTLSTELLQKTYGKKFNKNNTHSRLKRVSELKIKSVRKQKQFKNFYKKQLADPTNDTRLKKKYENSPFLYKYIGILQKEKLLETEVEESDLYM